MTSLDREGFWGGTEVVFENTNFWFTIGTASFSPLAKEASRSLSPEIPSQRLCAGLQGPPHPKVKCFPRPPNANAVSISNKSPRPATPEGCQQRLFPPGIWRQSPSLTAPTHSPPDEILDPQAFCCFQNCCLNSQVRDCFSLSLLLLYCARRVCFTPEPVFIANTLFWPLSELLRVDYIISKQWLLHVPKASSDWYVVDSTSSMNNLTRVLGRGTGGGRGDMGGRCYCGSSSRPWGPAQSLKHSKTHQDWEPTDNLSFLFPNSSEYFAGNILVIYEKTVTYFPQVRWQR